MNWSSATVGGDFRASRICFSISGSLLLMLLLFVAQTASRPPDDQYQNFEGDDEYADVDNVEWHHIRVVDGVPKEGHPIIMYKEDFVTEDFDPHKNGTKSSEETGAGKPRHPGRKYKNAGHRHRNRINRNNNNIYNNNNNNNSNSNHNSKHSSSDHRDTAAAEKYHALKPENMLFDVLPQSPLLLADDSSPNDSRFHFQASPLVEVTNSADVNGKMSATEEDKLELRKHPKKYHGRSRRSLQTLRDHVVRDHVVHKRNPYYRYATPREGNLEQLLEILLGRERQSHETVKHPVPGKLWNSLNLPVDIVTPDVNTKAPPVVPSFSIEDRFQPDRVLWGSSSRTTRPPLMARPAVTARPAATTRRPDTTRRTLPPLFHNANPEDADFSFINENAAPRPAQAAAPAPTQAQRRRTSMTFQLPENNQSESDCASQNADCCDDQDLNVQYDCFQRAFCPLSVSKVVELCS